MTFIAVILMASWAWMLVRDFTSRIPGWFVHLTLVPVIAYLSLHAPPEIQNILGVSGGVMLIQLLLKDTKPVSKLPVKRRQSNIPPPP